MRPNIRFYADSFNMGECTRCNLALPSRDSYLTAENQTSSYSRMSIATHPAFDAFLKKYTIHSSPNPPIAVFDCDGTVIMGDIGEAMFFHQVENFLFHVSPADVWLDYPKREELKNQYESLTVLPPDKRVHDRRFISFAERVLSWYFDQLAEGKIEKACADIVRLFAGYTPQEVRRIAERTLQDELTSPFAERFIGGRRLAKGIRYIQESLDLLRQLREHGFEIWAVSGSNQWSVEAVFSRIGVTSDCVLGIDLFETNEHLLSDVKAPVPVLEGKVEILRKHLGRPPLIVVSDSFFDVPLFQYSAGLKVLVNSSDVPSIDFFTRGNITKDESWLVVENPNLQESVTAPRFGAM